MLGIGPEALCDSGAVIPFCTIRRSAPLPHPPHHISNVHLDGVDNANNTQGDCRSSQIAFTSLSPPQVSSPKWRGDSIPSQIESQTGSAIPFVF
jgi:hypothetical protein